MLLTLLISVFVLCLYGLKFSYMSFNDDYLSKDKTNSIKGIFILLIVLSHALQYINRSGYVFDGFDDFVFLKFFNYFSQLVVVMFLFYSGYGVSESFKKKGASYVKSMPRHRIVGTLLNFDVAVIVFIIVSFLLGITFSLNKCLLSLTGWESVGNSNWYIFVILLCYLMTFITLSLPVSKPQHRVGLLFALCVVCLIILSFFKDSYWYNTILCYPLGFMYSTYKEKIEACLKKSYLKYFLATVLGLVVLYILQIFLAEKLQISYNLMSMAFALTVVLMTMKVSIGNSPLSWLGRHLFPVYIYMRLPMIFMEQKTPGLISSYPALFIIISFIITLLIARSYKYWEIRL